MADSSDGGIWALAGYLYQIVGTLALTARVHGPVDPPDANQPDADLLLELHGVGQAVDAHPECFGNDAVFMTTDLTNIAQFKYSRNPVNKIDKGELREIIDKLDASAREALTSGYNVTACLLITNRQFTSQGDGAEGLWKTEQAVGRPYVLRRRLDFTIEAAVRDLEQFARQYGALDDEIESGIFKAVGKVFTQTSRQAFDRVVSIQDLIAAFTGTPSAHELTVESVALMSREGIDRFGAGLRMDQWLDAPVTRGVFDDVVRATRDRALVWLYGSGGSGKSTLLWQITKAAAGCRRIDFATYATRSWIEDTIHEWRGLPTNQRSTDDAVRAIARLEAANPLTPRPILLLALDGVDERVDSVEQRNCIRSLLTWFWKLDSDRHRHSALPATLLVTSRDFDDASAWLDLSSDDLRERPKCIAVEDFSARELVRAMERAFPATSGIASSPPTSPFALGQGDYDTLPSTLPSGATDFEANDIVLDALRHPAMWRALLRLPDESTRKLAIENDAAAVDLLVGNFLQWFGDKLKLRVRDLHMTPRELVQVLQAIALDTISNSRLHKERDWIEPACRAPDLIDRRGAGALFEEAASAGLIVCEGPLLWRWRHPIVSSYLIRQSEVSVE